MVVHGRQMAVWAVLDLVIWHADALDLSLAKYKFNIMAYQYLFVYVKSFSSLGKKDE